MTPVGFEPTQLALVELESTPLRPLGQSVLTNMQVVCQNPHTQILIQIKLRPKQNLIGAVPASKVKPIKHVISNVKMAM
jgi:hypothetical protein